MSVGGGARLAALVMALVLVMAAPALAQEEGGGDRPGEDALFGDDPAGEPERPDEDALFGEDASDAPAADGREDARGDAVLSGPPAKDRFASGEAVDDPLMIGGQFYLRYFANAVERTQFKNIAFSSPNLLDLYLDGRPSERVRGFARFRMRYDPTYDPGAPAPFGQLVALLGSAGTPQQSQDTGTGTVITAPGTRANPDFLLDQLWLNFDIRRTVFVTAGRQHIRWTVSRFWQPTDFLSPQLRDPLAVFDQRLGANAIKLHVPVESRGWNFYAVSLFDNFGPANALGELGQAFRAELVKGSAELGATAVFQRGRGPRYGLDVSAGIGPVDVHGEAALRPRADRQMVRYAPGSEGRTFEQVLERQIERGVRGLSPSPDYETFTPEGPIVQATGGATYTAAYTDTDTVTIGVEYFYNQLGYSDGRLFPAAVLTGTYVPFYAGQQYAGAFVLLPGPGRMDNGTVVLSTLGNLSDRSFVSRVDFSYRALSFLQLEAFAAWHYGRSGEFNFRVDLPADQLNLPPRPGAGEPDFATPEQRAQIESLRQSGVFQPAPTFDFGVGVRISL